MKCVAIFFLDAVRYSYLSSMDAPFLYKMAQAGLSGPLKTILGFDGIAATIFTGTYPDVHGVWTQYKLAAESAPFDWIGPLSGILEQVDKTVSKCRILWKAFRYAILQASLFRAGVTHYPGCSHKIPFRLLSKLDVSMRRKLYEKGAFGPIPTLFDLLREKGITDAMEGCGYVPKLEEIT